MHKKLKVFELDIAKYVDYNPSYQFPKPLLPCIDGRVYQFGVSLTSLRLVGVNIMDDVVNYYLASCPNLEQLCIRGSCLTKNLKFADPLPNLRVLEVSNCPKIQSLEISLTNLVSCTYQGSKDIFRFKEIPNLTELTLGGDFARSFIYEPKRHTSYSVQLVKLVLNNLIVDPYLRIHRPELPRLGSLEHLELNVMLPIGKSIHFFAKLINASPLLKELTIKVSYISFLFFFASLIVYIN
ncbi:hypothetical protein PHJA_001745600 [Phtheirospermum japonicum]|uniref:At1g61320/AtMIF1 LRR domain-containing protein n=1 Tax=Phtheirospermum japonicum TaxID=374723 RepID=A0A830CLQ5_9LAMI|nr:hypothetical protein PHJA_001745600 [Phtheirospermum japonicum]